MPIRTPRPVTDYLQLQKRFAHLFANTPEAHTELEHFQALADHNAACVRTSARATSSP